MREQKDIAADIVKNLRQLADVVQEFAESFQCITPAIKNTRN